MRLIDADALGAKVEEIKWLQESFAAALVFDAVMAIADGLPTIDAEPVRHSENVTPYSGDENILCKECGFEGEVCAYKYDEYGNYVDANGFACKYCPHCGAKMGGGDHIDP